ncbi:MAG TPA: hypothetical protein VF463_19230 [Sphingobium sp.]
MPLPDLVGSCAAGQQDSRMIGGLSRKPRLRILPFAILGYPLPGLFVAHVLLLLKLPMGHAPEWIGWR